MLNYLYLSFLIFLITYLSDDQEKNHIENNILTYISEICVQNNPTLKSIIDYVQNSEWVAMPLPESIQESNLGIDIYAAQIKQNGLILTVEFREISNSEIHNMALCIFKYEGASSTVINHLIQEYTGDEGTVAENGVDIFSLPDPEHRAWFIADNHASRSPPTLRHSYSRNIENTTGFIMIGYPYR